jgi:hypothetical protein
LVQDAFLNYLIVGYHVIHYFYIAQIKGCLSTTFPEGWQLADDFVEAVASIPEGDADVHLRSQYIFLTNMQGSLCSDSCLPNWVAS